MLSVFLACDDPYEAAGFMTGELGARSSPRRPTPVTSLPLPASATPRSCWARAAEEFLAAASRQHRGAGVTVYVQLPAGEDIAAVHARHASAGVVTGPLTQRPWGELAFDAVICGYRYLISQQPPPARAD